MANRRTADDQFTFACIADVAAHRIVMDHPVNQLNERMIGCFAAESG